jgi:hypothetical protein
MNIHGCKAVPSKIMIPILIIKTKAIAAVTDLTFDAYDPTFKMAATWLTDPADVTKNNPPILCADITSITTLETSIFGGLLNVANFLNGVNPDATIVTNRTLLDANCAYGVFSTKYTVANIDYK